MPFSAINTYEEEAQVRNERHTLEIQLEKAMSVYKSALMAQSTGDVLSALSLYEKLFSYDVLKTKTPVKKGDEFQFSDDSNDSLNLARTTTKSLQLGPAIRLRAMALKNYALLFLAPSIASKQNIITALTFLLEALDLVGTNDKEQLVIPSLTQLSFALNHFHLTRLGLEIMAQNDYGKPVSPLYLWTTDRQRAEQALGPKSLAELNSLEYITSLIANSKAVNSVPPFLTKYLYLQTTDSCISNDEAQETNLTVSIGTKTWRSLINSINAALHTVSKPPKRRYGSDDYLYSQRGVWSVEFVDFFLEPVGKTEPVVPEQSEKEEDSMQVDEEPLANAVEADTAEVEEPGESGEPGEAAETAVVEEAGEVEEVEEAGVEETEETGKPDENKPSEEGLEVVKVSTPPPSNPAVLSNAFFFDDYGSPNKRRRTGRSKRSTLALPVDFGVVDAGFVNQFNAYLSMAALTDKNLQLMSPASLFLESNNDVPEKLFGALELKDLLYRWDNRESVQFLSEATSIKPEKGGILATLRSSSNKPISRDQDDNDDNDEDENVFGMSTDVESFIQQHNGQHIQQIRLSLARKLLGILTTKSGSLSFGKTVLKLVDEIESTLFERQQFLTNVECTAIFGLYADKWISDRSDDLKLKTERWGLISSRSQSIEHAWISVFAEQELEEVSPEESVKRFEAFLNTETTDGNCLCTNQLFTHFYDIPLCTKDNAKLQISKFKAAAAFEKVLAKPKNSTENSKNIDLLEAMLMPDSHERPAEVSETEFEAISKFLQFAQPQFKLGLWYILLERYQHDENVSKSLKGLNNTFLESMLAFSKGEPLLTTLSVAHDVAKRLIPMFEKFPDMVQECLSNNEIQQMLFNIVSLLQIMQLFLLYDDAVNSNLIQRPATPSWPKVLVKFRELVTMWWCIFFQYWLCLLKPEINATEAINDFLSIIHERLGNLGYCGMGNMCLLHLHIRTLVKMDWIDSALDLCQCLNCMLGISWGLYGEVAKHHTIPIPLTREIAAKVLPMIIKLILNHKYLNQTLMRQDTRLVMDDFSKAIIGEDAVSSNNAEGNVYREYFYKFLNADFTVDSLKNAWHGHNDGKIDLVSHTLKKEKQNDYGLSLIQGTVILHQYKLRRRQVYNAFSIRIETLDQAIDLFIDDIMCNPNRIESWAGIAVANSLYCEDSTIFASELNLDKDPAGYCKSALIASSRAVSLMIQNKEYKPFQQELYDSLCPQIWSILGNSLLMATMPPLCEKPFETSRVDRPFLVEIENSDIRRVALKPAARVSPKLALYIAKKCLGKRHDDQTDWINLLHRTFAARKLKMPPRTVLKYALETREACPSANILEVDVELVGLVWRFLRNGLMPESELKEYMKPVLESAKINEEEKLMDTIANAFNYMAEKDKWLHKARYYLAKLWELDRQDAVKAEEQLMHLFTLKSPSKPLVIWRRDADLPGQYSVSMNIYVKYMGDLMLHTRDSDLMLLLVKRFRKSAVDFWDHSKCFEKIYSQCCILFRHKVGLYTSNSVKLSDPVMSELASKGSEKFDLSLKYLCDDPKTQKPPLLNDDDTWVQALFYIAELRRSNTGPATSAMADELLILVFYGIMQKFVPENKINEELKANEEASKPNQQDASKPDAEPRKPEKAVPKKKIIRKDVVNGALQFLRPYNAKLAKLDSLSFPTDLMRYVTKPEPPHASP